MSLLVCVGLLAMGSPVAPEKTHRWYDQMIAGYVVRFSEAHPMVARRDPKSGYMIIRSAECDGADVSLLLTRDRKMVAELGYVIPGFNDKASDPIAGRTRVETFPFRSLATGKGVTIGDTTARVRSLLGAPTKKEWEGPGNRFTIWKYEWKDSPDGDIEQSYTFKADRLIEVQFSRSANPGE